jgi:hypothetical protein
VLKAIHHSLFRVKAYGAGPPINGVRNKAVGLYFCVCTRFDDLTITPFDGQSLDWPQGFYEQCIGLWLDMLPGAGAGPTCDCQFNNPVIEVCAIGGYIQSGVGNQFFGGTIEQCTDTGLNIQDGESNRAWALWLEGNKNYDVVLGPKARGTNLITKHPSALKMQNNATWWAGNSVT